MGVNLVLICPELQAGQELDLERPVKAANTFPHLEEARKDGSAKVCLIEKEEMQTQLLYEYPTCRKIRKKEIYKNSLNHSGTLPGYILLRIRSPDNARALHSSTTTKRTTLQRL